MIGTLKKGRAVSNRTSDLRCLHARHAKDALRFRAEIGPCSGCISLESTESRCGTSGRADMLVKQKSLRNRMLYTKHPAREGLVYTLEKTAGQGNGRLVSFELVSICRSTRDIPRKS